MDTTTTPSFLELTGTSGFWATKAKGENVVIGIIDSGIWAEHPSFADRTGVNGNAIKGGKLGYPQILGWSGKCTRGEQFPAGKCNQTLIGAQYFNEGFGGNARVKGTFPYEFNSVRDAVGHGLPTASTAGGSANVPATGPASVAGGTSGIAPRAHIGAYKICWGSNGEGGSAGVDNVAVFNRAVADGADGADAIDCSNRAATTNFRDPVEIAFLFAALAGKRALRQAQGRTRALDHCGGGGHPQLRRSAPVAEFRCARPPRTRSRPAAWRACGRSARPPNSKPAR